MSASVVFSKFSKDVMTAEMRTSAEKSAVIEQPPLDVAYTEIWDCDFKYSLYSIILTIFGCFRALLVVLTVTELAVLGHPGRYR